MKLFCTIASHSVAGISLIRILAFPAVGLSQTSPPTSGFRNDTNFNSHVTPAMAAFGSRGVRVHDPSTIVRCKDDYWVFYTGRGVPSYHSKDLVVWEPGPRVFDEAPTWTKHAVPEHHGSYFWAPDVMRLGDHYLLYYAVSTFGKKVSAIGLATNPTLDPDDPGFAWTDQGEVIRSTNTNDFNTIDPAICRDFDGKLWLVFGSYWSGIKLIQLDPKTGKRISPGSPIYPLASSGSIEASYIYPHAQYYYLFLNWGSCCKGTNSTYNIRVGRSKQIIGPYVDQNGVQMLAGGGSLFLGSRNPFIGPGHAGIVSVDGSDWFSCHFYDATRAGTPTLAILPLHWNHDWPEIVQIKASE